MKIITKSPGVKGKFHACVSNEYRNLLLGARMKYDFPENIGGKGSSAVGAAAEKSRAGQMINCKMSHVP